MSSLARACTLVAALVTVACSRSAPDARSAGETARRAAVDSAAGRLMNALRTNAADSLDALLADDVRMMPPNEPAVEGKAAVRAWYDEFLTQFRTTSLVLTSREVFVGDETATEFATFVWTLAPVAGGPAVVDHGTYAQVWRRTPDGRWLFSREVWNSSAPPTVPAKTP